MYRILPWLVLLFLLPAFSRAQRFAHFDKLEATGSGQEYYSLPVRDLAFIGIDVYEKELNLWVERFWRREGFKTKKDFFLEISLPTRNLTHVLTVMHVADTVYNADPDFDIHERMGRMIIDELKGKVWTPERFDWVFAVRTKYQGGEPSQSAEISPQLQFIIPRIKFGEPLPTSTRSFMDTTLTVYEVLRRRIGLSEPKVRTKYSAFAAFDGLKLNKDVTFEIKKVPLYTESYALVFTFAPEVKVTERMLLAHYRVGQELKKVLLEDVKPVLPFWMNFISMADTSGNPFRIDLGKE